MCWQLVAAQAHELLESLRAAEVAGQNMATAAVLQGLLDQGPPLVCIGLPAILSAHICLGLWSEICIPAQPAAWVRCNIQPALLAELWTYFVDRPAGFRLPHPFQDPEAEAMMRGAILSAPACQRAADSIRTLAMQLQLQGAARPEDTQEAATMAAVLQCAADTQQPPDLLTTRPQQKGGQGYPVKQLVQGLLLTSHLRNSTHLQAVITRSVQMVCPSNLASEIVDQIKLGTLPVPSAATLSRHQQTLLAGLLLHQRKTDVAIASPESIRYLLVDSSPQGGREWLLVAASTIPAAELLRGYEAAEMIRNPADMPDDLEEVTRCMDFLNHLLKFRPLLPVGLGSGRASCVRKIHAMTWAMLLACGGCWYATATALSNTTGFTTDHGTERLLAVFPRCPMSRLFPWADIDLEHLVNNNHAWPLALRSGA